MTSNKAWNIYVSFVGTWSVSKGFLESIENSTRQFYKESIPTEVSATIDELKDCVSDLIGVFSQFDENTDDLF